MKTILFLSLFFLSFGAFSQNKPLETLSRIQRNLLSIDGVNAVGLRLCDEDVTGNDDVAVDIVPTKIKCVFVRTSSETVFLTLKTLFGNGERKLDGVVVSPEWGDSSIPQPRLSAGN